MVSSSQSLPHLVNSWAKIALLGVFFFFTQRQLISAGIYGSGESCRLLCEKKKKKQSSKVYNNAQPHLHNPPRPDRRKRERKKLHTRTARTQTRPAVSSLTALLKAKGWIAVCSPALPFGLAENCGSVMPVDPDTQTGHQRRFLPMRPPAFTLKWLACRKWPNPVTHTSKVQLQASENEIDFIMHGMSYVVQDIKQ